MSTPPDPASARQDTGSSPDPSEPVSLDKPAADEPAGDAPLDFDPYRFGRPEHPVPPEYAPPGYQPPVQYPGPPAYTAPPNYPGPPTYAGGPPNYPGPAGYPGPGGYQPPHPGFPPVPAPPQYNLHYPQPRTGNGKAIAGMVLGISSIVFCWLSVIDLVLIVPAIVFSSISLSAAKRAPSGDGRGMAIAGLVCAIVGAVVATALTVYLYGKVQQCDQYDSGSSQFSQCIRDHI